MADNTRVKKLARKLQAETGLRYTEALARVRLQGAPAVPERNTMNINETLPETVDTLVLGTHTLAPGAQHTFRVLSERIGFAKGLDIQAPNLAVLVVDAYTIGGHPQLIGQYSCPATLVVGNHQRRVGLSPTWLIEVVITNHGAEAQEVAVSVDFEDRTAEAVRSFASVLEDDGTVEVRKIQPNQYNGLGSVVIPPGGTSDLQDVCNRNMRVTQLALETAAVKADVPRDWVASQIQVMAIGVGGLPVNLGSKGFPLSALKENPVLAGTIVLVGQSVTVYLHNPTEHAVVVSGGILCDEINPYWMQRHYEDVLVQAAVRVSKEEPSVNPQVGQSEPWRAAQAGSVEVNVRPVAGHRLESLDLTVVGSAAPEGLLLNGVALTCDWFEADEAEDGWSACVSLREDRVWNSGDALSVVVQGAGVVAAKVFTAWRPAQPSPS